MNTIQSILLHLDDSPRCAARIGLARRLAQRHEAALDAMYAVESAFIAMPFAVAESSGMAAMTLKLDKDRRERARAQFDRVMTEPGVPAEWSELGGDPVIWGFVQRALCADLLVLGQHEAVAPGERSLPSDFVESVLVNSGKPALIIPYANAADSLADRALVAWSATRESAHALEAALPLLQRAGHVDVVAWEDKNATGSPDDRKRLTRFLDRHGITATMHWYGPAPVDIGNHLLSLAADLHSDLLVMGCYGHSRARELVLGGTTRTVLKSMTIPVLMAH